MSTNKEKLRILLVDDEENNHTCFTLDYEDLGVELVHAFSGFEAFKILKDEAFDLVISDLQMEDGDGQWLLEKIKSNYPNTPVAMWTGASSRTLRELDLSHALTVINKGSWEGHDEMKTLVETFLEKKNPILPEEKEPASDVTYLPSIIPLFFKKLLSRIER